MYVQFELNSPTHHFPLQDKAAAEVATLFVINAGRVTLNVNMCLWLYTRRIAKICDYILLNLSHSKRLIVQKTLISSRWQYVLVLSLTPGWWWLVLPVFSIGERSTMCVRIIIIINSIQCPRTEMELLQPKFLNGRLHLGHDILYV